MDDKKKQELQDKLTKAHEKAIRLRKQLKDVDTIINSCRFLLGLDKELR